MSVLITFAVIGNWSISRNKSTTSPGRMPIFIAKFLINRKFSVWIGGTLSEIYDQEEVDPQGSILAVTLFSIKINSIMKCLGNV